MQEIVKALGAKLRIFALKIDMGIITSSHSSAPQASLEDKLGFGLTPIQKREAAYKRFQIAPQLCTPADMILIELYRYENNLMTPEEEAKYEGS
jgi:hypothetical protein